MKHEMKARYPAPSSVVIKMFSDKDFHTRKLDVLGLKKYQVLEHGMQGDEFRIRIERHVPVAAPGIVKKAIPAETRVLNEERWNVKKKTGFVKAEPQGVPVEMSCTAAMKDERGECVITYQWDVTSKLPLVGGTLEKFIVSDMEKRAAEELRAAITLLDGYR